MGCGWPKGPARNLSLSFLDADNDERYQQTENAQH